MAKTNYQSIDEYHQAFSGETLARMQTIRKSIHEIVPDAVEGISYQIPCFKYNGYLIYYGAFPKHISLSHPYSDAFWEHFKADLQGYKTSKSVIQMPMDKPLPEALIRKIITFRKKENEENVKKINSSFKLIFNFMENSVSLHRVIQASPEKVFRAFSDPIAQATWLPPYGFLCTVQKMDFEVGGTYRMTFINFSTGNGHSFGGTYVEIKPNAYIKYTDKFDDPALPGEMTTTVWLNKVSCGTELKVVQEGIPAMIPAEMCYLGWQESLDKLIKLVEPEIPDGQ